MFHSNNNEILIKSLELLTEMVVYFYSSTNGLIGDVTKKFLELINNVKINNSILDYLITLTNNEVYLIEKKRISEVIIRNHLRLAR